MTSLTNLENDVPLAVAHAAHYGTSFVPEKRAQQERDGYAESLQADYERFAAYAATDEKRAMLEEEFARYREGYRKRNLAYLASRSRIVSWMIAGPSNFPSERMRKRGDVAHKRLTEFLEWRERARGAIIKKLCPGDRPIMAGDADALERLAKEIEDAERLQEIMKEANTLIRKYHKHGPEAQIAVLAGIGINESRARRLLEPDACHGTGFPDYRLRNNGANIRRMKQRIAKISIAKSTPDAEIKGKYATIEDCPAENRVRLFFPGKPDEAVRSRLKSSGFRWTPSLGCWQAYRNNSTKAIATEIAGSPLTRN